MIKFYNQHSAFYKPTFKRLLCIFSVIASLVFHQKLQAQVYCATSVGTNGNIYYVDSIKTTGGITNISHLNNNPIVVNSNGYTDLTSQIVTGVQGSSFQLFLHGRQLYQYHWSVFIDWNQNGILDDPGEVVYSYLTGTQIQSATVTVNIPAGAAPGNTRMRVGMYRISTTTDPCYNGTAVMGYITDFTVNVVSLTPCTNPVVAGAATKSPAGQTCPGAPISLGLSGITLASNQTYEWESSPNNVTYTSIGAAANSPNTVVSPLTTTWYRCKVVCSGGTPAYSTPIQADVATGLAGTYTVNSAAATGGTNFNNFTDLAAALNCGIVAPVTVNVAAGSGPYIESFNLNAIGGASAVNKVRINGNGATLQFSTASTYSGVLMLNGTKYLTIDSLTFKSTNTTHGFGAILYNGCEYDSITRCTFDLTSVTTTTAANSSGIRISSTSSGTSTTASGASFSYFGNNKIIGTTGSGGPYYGIYAYGPNTSNIYENNLISNYYYYGAYFYYGDLATINNNVFTRQTKTGATNLCYGLINGFLTGGSKVTNNRVEYLGGAAPNTTYGYPLQLISSAGTAAAPVLAANNVVTNMNTVPLNGGIYINGGTNVDVFHNTVNIEGQLTYSSTTIQAGIQNACATARIQNNNVSYTGGGPNTKYGLYYGTAPAVSNFNNVYMNSTSSGTQSYGYSGVAHATLAAFQAATAFEANGTSVIPQFTNPAIGNLLPTNPILTSSGTTLNSIVPTDIIGVLRKVIPTPGAWEVPVTPGNDGGILALISPSALFCANQQPVKVSIVNSGTIAISNFQVHWSFNGIAQPPYSYTSTLPIFGAGQYIDTITLGSPIFSTGNNQIKVWIVVSNDVNNLNDTLQLSVAPTDFLVSSIVDTICSGNDATLNLNPNTGYSTGMIQWQSSTNGTTFTNIVGADQATLTSTNLTASRWYRAFINSGTGGCYSTIKKINVINPSITAVQNGVSCGPGTANLSASAPAGSTISWFDVPTGGTALGTGSTFTTPNISANTTYYAQASVGGGAGFVGPVNPTAVGAGGGTAAAITTYHMAFDVLAPTTLISIDIFPTATVGSTSAIQIQDNASNIIATVPYITTVTGGTTAQTITLNVTLPPGTGYKMGQQPAINLFRNTAGAVYPYTSSAINIVSNNFGAGYYYYFYNWQFASGCESARVPVQANVNPIPTVNLGADLNVCTNGSTTQVLNAGSQPGATYLWDNGVTTQTRTVNTTGNYSVALTRNGCTAYDTVLVTFNNNPVVNLGNDTAICDGHVLVLNAGNPGASYLWENSSTGMTRNATTAGAYYVRVTDANNCIGRDTLVLGINQAPFVNIGNDTAICEGAVLTLDAGNPGSPTLWDNGSTNQFRNVSDSGMYFVAVSEFGCISTDTINISFLPNPSVFGINAVYGDTATYTFYPIDAQYAIGYKWNFGDGSPIVSGYQVQHTYTSNGIFNVTLSLDGACVEGGAAVERTVDVFDAKGTSVGDQAVNNQFLIYPNPSRDAVTIETKTSNKIAALKVYNVLGQIVYGKNTLADNASKHTFTTQNMASGMYTVHAELSNGTLVIRKFEVVK